VPEKTLPLHQVQGYLVQLVQGVNYIHSHGVIHRDIKPANLLLTNDEVLKLSDFGSAYELDRYQPDDGCLTSAGTTPFQPPEIVNAEVGQAYSGTKVDVWACGVTLWNMATGTYPFPIDDGSLFLLLNAIGKGEYTIPEGVEAGLEALLRAILEMDVAKRLSGQSIITLPLPLTQRRLTYQSVGSSARCFLSKIASNVLLSQGVGAGACVHAMPAAHGCTLHANPLCSVQNLACLLTFHPLFIVCVRCRRTFSPMMPPLGPEILKHPWVMATINPALPTADGGMPLPRVPIPARAFRDEEPDPDCGITLVEELDKMHPVDELRDRRISVGQLFGVSIWRVEGGKACAGRMRVSDVMHGCFWEVGTSMRIGVAVSPTCRRSHSQPCYRFVCVCACVACFVLRRSLWTSRSLHQHQDLPLQTGQWKGDANAPVRLDRA
jgi:hypothetical protein